MAGIKFIEAYEKGSKKKVLIPSHWLEVESLAKNFSRTSRQRGAAAEPPANTATVESDITTTPNTPGAGDNEKE